MIDIRVALILRQEADMAYRMFWLGSPKESMNLLRKATDCELALIQIGVYEVKSIQPRINNCSSDFDKEKLII